MMGREGRILCYKHNLFGSSLLAYFFVSYMILILVLIAVFIEIFSKFLISFEIFAHFYFKFLYMNISLFFPE